MDTKFKNDNDLARNTKSSNGIDMRGNPRSSISHSFVDKSLGNSQPTISTTSQQAFPSLLSVKVPPPSLEWKSSQSLKGKGRFRRPITKPVQQMLTLENMFTPISEEFFLLEPNSNMPLPLNHEKVFRVLEKAANIKRDKISSIRGGKLLIKTTSEDQSIKLKSLKTVNNCSVDVRSHPTLNQVQGTIFAKALMEIDTEDLKEGWMDQGLKVKNVYRFSKRIGEEKVPTPRLLITFEGLNLPKYILNGWLRFSINPFIPRPKRCYNCNRIGHVSKFCRSSKTCFKCAQPYHSPCLNSSHCINCNSNHPANDPKCPRYNFEKEIIYIKTTEKCSFSEAKWQASLRCPNLTQSYSQVTSKSFTANISEQNPVPSSARQSISPSRMECSETHQQSKKRRNSDSPNSSEIVQSNYSKHPRPSESPKNTSPYYASMKGSLFKANQADISLKRMLPKNTHLSHASFSSSDNEKYIRELDSHHSQQGISAKIVVNKMTVQADVHVDSSIPSAKDKILSNFGDNLEDTLRVLDGSPIKSCSSLPSSPKAHVSRRRSLISDFPMPYPIDEILFPKTQRGNRKKTFKKSTENTSQSHNSDPRKRHIEAIITDRLQ
jgi:hypothetical protein